MRSTRTNPHRRRFLRLAAAGAATAPVIALFPGRAPRASDLPRLDPASERAQLLSYTHDAESTDNPAREPDARCANCTHFRGDAGTQWASCNIFPEHLVNADGWCSSWFSAG